MHPKLRVTPVNNVGMRSGADVVGGVPIHLVFGGVLIRAAKGKEQRREKL